MESPSFRDLRRAKRQGRQRHHANPGFRSQRTRVTRADARDQSRTSPTHRSASHPPRPRASFPRKACGRKRLTVRVVPRIPRTPRALLFVQVVDPEPITMSPGPNPNDLDLDLQRAHAAATPRRTSVMTASNDHTVVAVSGRNGFASNGGNGAALYGDLNNVGDPPSHVHASAKSTIPPYAPRMTETFTTVILIMLTAGIVACACVFPYVGALDAKADDRRWEITLARWTLAEGLPEYKPIAQFATAPATEGIELYLTRDDTVDFDVADAPTPSVDADAPAASYFEDDADVPAAAPAAASAAVPAPPYRPVDTVDRGNFTRR